MSAWPDVKPAFNTTEFRWLARLGLVLLPAILALDVLAGLLKHQGIVAAEDLSFLRIAEQHSIAEFVGFQALLMAAISCLAVAWRLQSHLHFAFATVLEYLFLDDMFGLHEEAGARIGTLLTGSIAESVAGSLGELAYGLVVCTIIGLLFWSFFQRSTQQQRSLFGMLLIPFVLLGVCAVGVDFIHGIVPRSEKYIGAILVLVEDGGELCAMYLLMLVAAAQCLAHATPARSPLILQQA